MNRGIRNFTFCMIAIFYFNIVVAQQAEKKCQTSSEGYIEIDGTKLNYVIEGKGKPCLVIGSSVYYPKTFSNELKDHLKMYFVDMRWFAKDYSPVNLEDYTLQTIIDDIEKIRSGLNLEKFIIMGHSIHGTIAFEYARKHPDRVTHVVVIGSPNVQSNQEQEDAINKMWKTASEERKIIMEKNWQILEKKKNLTPAQFDIELYCLMSPKYWYDPNYDACWLWEGMTDNSDILHYLYDGIFLNYYMFKNDQSVPVPMFVALGRYDYVDPYTTWIGCDTIPRLKIKIFEKSGHTPQLEENERFTEELMQWLRNN